MMGLLPPQARVSGRARLEGVDLLGAARQALRGRDVAMIFQDPMTSLTPHLRIGDQIAEPLVDASRHELEGCARAARRILLDQVRMNDVPRRLRQYPHELSGGMRQRAMIAMALACEPAAADRRRTDHGARRVGAGADPRAAARNWWRERDMALAVVTHDMGVIAALADDVVVMREGRIVERGPVARILAAPRTRIHARLLAATPRVETPGAGIAARRVDAATRR